MGKVLGLFWLLLALLSWGSRVVYVDMCMYIWSYIYALLSFALVTYGRVDGICVYPTRFVARFFVAYDPSMYLSYHKHT